MNRESPVIVSIKCTVYNHERFLRQCLDGFVMQKTDFRFEAIVHDDASTDRSAEIIREYAEKYPDIIKPIYETENQYSKHDGSLSRIMNSHVRGKYVAMCEGDDYWIDPLKLQKQVGFLEQNPEYSMCFHNAYEHYEDNAIQYCCKKNDLLFSNVKDKEYTGPQIYNKWIVPTASVVFRSDILRTDFYRNASTNPNFIYGDIVLFLSCARYGKIRGFSNVMSVYRRHLNGMTLMGENDIAKSKAFLKHTYEIYKVFGASYKSIVSKNVTALSYRLYSKTKNVSFLRETLKFSFPLFILSSMLYFMRQLKQVIRGLFV